MVKAEDDREEAEDNVEATKVKHILTEYNLEKTEDVLEGTEASGEVIFYNLTLPN